MFNAIKVHLMLNLPQFYIGLYFKGFFGFPGIEAGPGRASRLKNTKDLGRAGF